MNKRYTNLTLISITDRAGENRPDDWRTKYFQHTGMVTIAYEADINSRRMYFSSDDHGGLIAVVNKYHETDSQLVIVTTNSIYTFNKGASFENQ
jgi:hypothetical protein